jgi:orotate phosphoribosyltransferase
MEIIGLILGVLGLFGLRELTRVYDGTFGRWWMLLTWSADRVKAEVRGIVCEHVITFVKPQNCATYGEPIFVKFYIDFMSAATLPDRKALLERCMLRWIKLKFSTLPAIIAVSKLGNVILAEAIARRLNRPLLLVRQDTHLFIRGGHSLEGRLAAGDRVLLVEDVASDGVYLLRCLEQMRAFQAEIVGVMCLVNRGEGNSVAVLAEAQVPFTFVEQLDDGAIEAMIASQRDARGWS